MKRTISFPVLFVTIIVGIVDYCPRNYADDPSLNRSAVQQISIDAEKNNESLTAPPRNTEKTNGSLAALPQNTGKNNESLAKLPQNTGKKDESLTTPSQNTGKNNESSAKPPQSTEKWNESLIAPSQNIGKNNESLAKSPQITEKNNDSLTSPPQSTENKNETLTAPPQNTEKTNESLTTPSQNTGKNNESLAKSPQSTEKWNESLIAPSQNTGKNNESLTAPPQNTEKWNDSLTSPSQSAEKKDESSTAPSQNTGKNNESLVTPSQNGTVDKFECRRQPCVRKCCADGKVFRYRIDITDIECVEPFDIETDSFADRLKRLLILSPETNESSSSSFVGIEYGKRCEGHDFLNYPNDTFTLLNGGSRIDFQTDTVNGSMADFCIEFIANENRLVPLLCPITVIEHQKVHPLYPITLSISALFMSATVFVLHSVGKLKTLSSKIQSCHVISLMIGYLFLIPTQIYQFYETCKPFCFVAAIGVQFFFLASFFWLNVFSFDMWRRFRGVRNQSCKREDRKQFIRYSTYAWGCPTVITSITLLAEFWPKMSEVFPYPNLADKSCAFGSKLSSVFYFYGPMGIVLALNGVIFCAVFKICFKTWRLLGKFSNNSEPRCHTQGEKNRFAVCLKLFTVMGVCWIMEVVSALVGGPEQMWYATDICNSMQGVAIFFITICSNQPRRVLRQKFSMIRLKSTRQSTSSEQTTVSELNVT